MLRLTAVTGPHGSTRALTDGTVTPRTCTLDFVEVTPVSRAFRRMVRELEWGVCEMAATTYFCARAYGKPITALPVFVTRSFAHPAVVHNPAFGLRAPADLEGKRVGVNRGWTVTTGVWVRGVLGEAYGVDWERVDWVRTGEEHVAESVPPGNVADLDTAGLTDGRDLAELAASGELAAAVGITGGHPELVPLIPDPEQTALEALRAEGLYPLNHLVVVADELLEAHPGLAADLFGAFAEAKQDYVKRLRAGAVPDPTPVDRTFARVLEVTGDDPLPYGVEANGPMIAKLLEYATRQRILPEAPPLESLFHPSTLGLNG